MRQWWLASANTKAKNSRIGHRFLKSAHRSTEVMVVVEVHLWVSLVFGVLRFLFRWYFIKIPFKKKIERTLKRKFADIR